MEKPYTHPHPSSDAIQPVIKVKKAHIAKLSKILSSKASLIDSQRGGI
jgi:DNA-directed RNA polymerase subunit L